MSIVRAERRRLLKRRFTKYMLLIGVLILMAVAAGTFFTNQKVGPQQIAEAKASAQQQYEQEKQRWDNGGKQGCLQAVGADPKFKDLPAAELENMCQGPLPEHFDYQWSLPETFTFKDEFPIMITVWAAIMALVAFVIGASYVGAEWHSGGMMNLLLWRPKRGVVLSAKLGTLLGAVAVWSTIVALAWTGVFWFIASTRGVTDGMTPGVWRSFGLMGLRGLGLALAIGAIGFALSSIGRHTAMALGVAAAVIVVFQFGVGIALSMAGVRWVEAYLLPTHMIAWMYKEYKIEDWQACSYSPMGECKPEELTLTWGTTGSIGLLIVAVLVGAAYWSMSRRDVA